MIKNFTSLEAKKIKTKQTKQTNYTILFSIDNDCDVRHCKSNCNLYKSTPTNILYDHEKYNTIICVYLKDAMKKSDRKPLTQM